VCTLYTVGPFNGIDRWDIAAAPAGLQPTDQRRPGRAAGLARAVRAPTRCRVTDHRGRVTPVQRGAERVCSTPTTKTSSRCVVGGGGGDVTASIDV